MIQGWLDSDIDKVIDWIELITYSETRNYVQRIMENIIIYKYLLTEKIMFDKLKEECGIFAIYNSEDAASNTALGSRIAASRTRSCWDCNYQ